MHRLLYVLLVWMIGNQSIMFGQEIQYESARLTISHKAKEGTQYEYIRLYGEEAQAFNVAKFLSENTNKDILVRGTFTSNEEILRLTFNTKFLNSNQDCSNFCQKVLSTEEVPFLGVSMIGEENFEGVVIESLVEGGSAADLGFEQGDVITQIGAKEIRSTCDLLKVMQDTKVDDVVDIQYKRDETLFSTASHFGSRARKLITWQPCCDQPVVSTPPVSVQTNAFAALLVSPNPTEGITEMEFTSSMDGSLVVLVTDLSGREVLRYEYPAFDGHHSRSIDLSAQPEGMYLINALHADETFTQKVVVQKR